METFNVKRQEMVFIVKVVLFSYFVKMKKYKSNYKKKLLQNEEITLDDNFFSFLSEAFELNIIVFSKENPMEEPLKFYYKEENQEEILNLAFLIDSKKRLRILIKENVLLEEEMASLKLKFTESQDNLKKSQRNYRNSVKVKNFLIKSLEDLKKKVNNPSKFKEKEKEVFDPLKEMIEVMKCISLKLKKFEFSDDEEKSQEEKESNLEDKEKDIKFEVINLFDAQKEEEKVAFFEVQKDLVNKKKKLLLECPICFDTFPMELIVSFGCGHKFCKECVKNVLLTKFDNGQWDFEIQCFMGTCTYKMSSFDSMPIFIALMGKEKVERMLEKLNKPFTIQCAKCKNTLMFAEPNEIRSYQCDKCGAWTCLNCGESKHDEKICKKTWEEMKLTFPNEKMRCCPLCLEIYLNDDHSDHVKCLKCRIGFCFNCSAPREPILGHGGHYHRRGCKYFFKLIDPKTKEEILEDHDEILPKCKDCEKNQKVCKRPELDLKTFYQKLGLDVENEENPFDE